MAGRCGKGGSGGSSGCCGSSGRSGNVSLIFLLFYLLLKGWQVNFNNFGNPNTLFPMFALTGHFYIATPIEIGLASGWDDEGITTGERHINGRSKALRKS